MVKFKVNDQEVSELRFPITPIGKESFLTVIIENQFIDNVELVPFTNDPDVEIVEWPQKLASLETAKAVWKFTPSADRFKEGKKISLDTQSGFQEIIG